MSLARIRRHLGRSAGFTLVELMVTLVVMSVIAIAIMTVLYASSRAKVSVANRLESTQQARVALDMTAHDIRMAGYGTDQGTLPAQPQPSIAYVDSLQILVNENVNGSIGQDTLAYDPNGTPKPAPLNGTAWTPPIKYRTGAELVRWTLDANNDGQVNVNDQTAVDGQDAARTPNPNDYVLLRQEYADSLNNVAGDNGGATEHVALVLRPGAGVPSLFTVYMRGNNTPWDWSNGPVPANQLQNIDRVVIQITSASARPDSKGNYARTALSTTVNTGRNTPNFGATEYTVDGYVYNDLNKNHQRDAGEPGETAAVVMLGALSTLTNSSGHYTLRAPAGNYVLKHTPAAAFGDFSVPDSFSIALAGPETHSFADTAVAGGWVKCYAYFDINGNGHMNGADTVMSRIRMTMNPGNQVGYTSTAGYVSLFAPVGTYTVKVTPPDSFAVTSPNPLTNTMPYNGYADSVYFGLNNTLLGTIKGTVYRDGNRNGLLDAGETGIQNVWVGVTPDGGVTVEGYAYTDASGNYSITCPVNDPPHTTPYSIMVVPPSGFYPTSTTAINPTWLQNNQTLSNQNFGMGTFTVISLTANRVLSLASKDLIEDDYKKKLNQAHGDADLVLGSDAGGTDNISVWFNQYPNTPLFNTTPDYTRLAPQSVLAMTLDTLDAGTLKNQPDLVTGTRYTPSGNFYVWFTQNSSGNEGYLPSSYSPGGNYMTADAGDVQAVLTLDCAGSPTPDQVDIIVGTKSLTAGTGTIEVWQSDNAASPSFTRVETYPPAGSIPFLTLGEVTCMALADLDGDGRKDLVVGTRRGDYSGQLLIFKNVSKVTGARFVYQAGFQLPNETITSVTCTDIDGDGKIDVITGSQTGFNKGKLDWWRNTSALGIISASLVEQVDAPGIVQSLTSSDFGGTTRGDLVVGYRSDASSYGGGVRIYFTDSGFIPFSGTDPSNGTIINMVPAVCTNNFNYGVYPSSPLPPYLADFAVGVKSSPTTGALVIFIR
jgi:prepilin-type N-terminal cleavage/methylation domain-containing protein